MLTALRQSDGWKVIARYANKADGPYLCASCRRELVLKKGDVRVNSFAHKPPVTCAVGFGESEYHMSAKLAIFDALQNENTVTDLEIEKPFGRLIADIFAVIDGVAVAVEIVRPGLTPLDAMERTRAYDDLGIAVVWVALPGDVLIADRYSPSDIEKWSHTAFYGRIYYWVGEQDFVPVHFVPHVEPGRDEVSKRWKTPLKGQRVVLSKDFRLTVREPWIGAGVAVPPCRLFIDKQPVWWR